MKYVKVITDKNRIEDVKVITDKNRIEDVKVITDKNRIKDVSAPIRKRFDYTLNYLPSPEDYNKEEEVLYIDRPMIILDAKQSEDGESMMIITDLTNIIHSTAIQTDAKFDCLRKSYQFEKNHDLAESKLFPLILYQWDDVQHEIRYTNPNYKDIIFARLNFTLVKNSPYLYGILNFIDIINNRNVGEVINGLEYDFRGLLQRFLVEASEIFDDVVKAYNFERYIVPITPSSLNDEPTISISNQATSNESIPKRI
ncbi:unnamed protein product [Candida verbasci]|uniref:Uncharacterized protein n=1 Tax=Candida verbasci TaxID=1227364 RepID=A0A9W4TZY2_9ASCO|nr:unnamed protein product [Candida verbasci]